MKVKLASFYLRNILRREDGQLTIFLAIGLSIFLTMMAFIINVGLFVRAKINLQNATDAAAWSGAAVQARQLSQIAYLNYEIRNVYKEWMFKYYILGNLGHTIKVAQAGSPYGDFRLQPAGNLNSSSNYDRYNIPSICVHAGAGVKDICLSSFVPGLPRFETIDLPNITDESQKFIDAISSKKSDDCSYRSSINFATALIWTYGTGTSLISEDLPALANSRLGAWPAALLLGARIRSMEAMVNRPAIDQGICLQANGGCMAVNDIGGEYAANERPIKAFYAGIRNLSGSSYKESDVALDETASTFKLEELAPQSFDAKDATTLSGMLIPSQNPPWNGNLFQKEYLDLQAIPINFAIFYTSFSARSEDLTIDGTTLPSDASCTTTKTALPAPAFVTGFQKNPNVLTYYAVRSTVKFSGLFFPFRDPIELSAVAAAKPFGGRIGPKLFQIENETTVMPRESGVAKSAAYISGLTPSVSAAAILDPGNPIPNGPNFWVSDVSSPVGGVPGSITPKFSIPNMIYNVDTRANADSELAPQFGSGTTQGKLDPYTAANQSKHSLEKFGLYDTNQFRMLLQNLRDAKTGNLTSPFTGSDLDKALLLVRQPTRYDALNYLIPTSRDFPNLNLKSNQNIVSDDPSSSNAIVLYGPLISDDGNAIYRNVDDLQQLVFDYIDNNRDSVESFLTGLKDVAVAIKNSGTGTLYDDASEVIYPLNENTLPTDAASFSSQADAYFCSASRPVLSIAARFSAFLQQKESSCPGKFKPLGLLIKDYVNSLSDSYKNYHVDTWLDKDDPNGGDFTQIDSPLEITSAYHPGPKNGADELGTITNPLSGVSYQNNRNYYSTKLIQFDLVSDTSRPKLLDDAYGTSLMEEFDGNVGMRSDVKSQMQGNYVNLLVKKIDVLW